MQVFRGFRHPGVAPACALTIGNFDGVHRGHQAMLALLQTEARQRGLPSCVLTFEPHPRDYFAALAKKPELAPARIGTLRDKLGELAACGVAQTVVLPFDARLASQSPEEFIQNVLVDGLGARYVLVGDDFRFGARRAGDYAMLDAAGDARGFDVARMNSYEISDPHARLRPAAPRGGAPVLGRPGDGHGLRVSSSAVREALAEGRMADAQTLLGRPYAISGHVVHGRKLGRALGASAPGQDDGFRTLNLRFKHWKPAASGIFVVLVHGLSERPLPGVANLGVRPSLDPNDVNAGRVLLETHCLEWPSHLGAEGAYGKIVRVELLHKLHDELRYTSLEALTAGIAKDGRDARAFFASTHAETHRQTTRDRI
ncbi:bifunctional riboflavin kinase/FMN adenylyltransferase [Variovorax paradoxus]|jgi:riboflavin kinase/FMN adenylyltransferase|uniref:bifunctional riboflavin kinase/FMN adenylyltransferase n=1 Tax=Variovorax TaxID=34072 RepID=UPI0006E5216E|nr:bifunctional riboflavin kinase/FMN adenylyltransferase [Variovorax paradoxus]KPV01283.1 bifunctional riboflavin kinase/FMN adenylyltransferase [Variovorax paradoxus]KPV02007.1 bifunctional riboflavin kinase/FMN adenylyltransferase [Variovorax paradoxus]KPV17500.1 bifunctional riboflavin kinase/FMN adenylyltransferase [Variovorax paradoxus]KPV19899.1 bifunctional riboflavin kinase/FMN adenylyltransferase [Variovorax paradoxus]